MSDNFLIYNILGFSLILLWIISFWFALKLPESKPNIIPANKNRLRRAVIIGYVVPILTLPIITFAFIIDPESRFFFAGVGAALLIALPFQMIATLRAYQKDFQSEIFFEWINKMAEKVKHYKSKPSIK